MQLDDYVQIKPNDRILDCCAGKRGRIAFPAVGGGWLLYTDHFCPVRRSEEELEPVPDHVRAQEMLDQEPERLVAQYEMLSDEDLAMYSEEWDDKLAWAVLTVRQAGEGRETE